MRIVGLKSEQLDNPLGLELADPRLSWRLEADRPGARQSAYRVRVATTPEALAAGGADLWDSGRIASGQCFDVAYAGPPPASRQRCWWTVDVWDEAEAPAEPPRPAFWEMGLLAPADWTAAWLAVEAEENRADREAGLRWVWGEDAAADPRQFRLAFRLEAPAEATLIVGARGRLDLLHLDGRALEREAPNPHAFGAQGVQRLALGALVAGEHVLVAEIAATPGPRDPRPWLGAFAALLKLRGDDGAIRRIVTGPDWETSAGGEAWTQATPAGHPPRQALPPTGAMLLRREFHVAAPVVGARLYATALGAYEAFLNGARVGDALLAPESTDFRHRTLYRVYDVTALVRAGANVLGAHVGDGWYASYVAPGGRYAFGPAPRRFLAQLELTFADSARQVVATGDGWRTAPSP
ncbi:MAG TPA: alpha-L-rhamnosidase N-terminal domain-containing protein, partial [Caulobacteraceae bacterium]